MVNCKNINENGRSMIEMLGVLAIIGVLSVGGIAGYSKAMMKYKINKTIEQITLIIGNMRSFFGQKGYDDSNTILKKAKIIPDEMWDGSSIRNVFGSTFNIYCVNKQGVMENCPTPAFYLQTGPIPDEACIEIATHNWSYVGVKAIIIYGDESSGMLKTPVSMENAVTYCVGADDSDGLEFYVDVDGSVGL